MYILGMKAYYDHTGVPGEMPPTPVRGIDRRTTYSDPRGLGTLCMISTAGIITGGCSNVRVSTMPINPRDSPAPPTRPSVTWGWNGLPSGTNPRAESPPETISCKRLRSLPLSLMPTQMIRGRVLSGKKPIPE